MTLQDWQIYTIQMYFYISQTKELIHCISFLSVLQTSAEEQHNLCALFWLEFTVDYNVSHRKKQYFCIIYLKHTMVTQNAVTWITLVCGSLPMQVLCFCVFKPLKNAFCVTWAEAPVQQPQNNISVCEQMHASSNFNHSQVVRSYNRTHSGLCPICRWESG